MLKMRRRRRSTRVRSSLSGILRCVVLCCVHMHVLDGPGTKGKKRGEKFFCQIYLSIYLCVSALTLSDAHVCMKTYLGS